MTGTASTLVPLSLGYVVVFAAAAVACLLSLGPVRRVEDADTRRGLVALLVTSAAWAATHVGFLLVPGTTLKTAFYLGGLVVGMVAVGAWLYFCSAYTGRTHHRNPTWRRAALVLLVGLTLLKITNPLHGLYFTWEYVETPFPHLHIHTGVLHWIAMGGAYALASVGLFTLFERFVQVSYDTRPLAGLVAVTGLPVVLNVVGVASPLLIDITYEPVGIAAFAVGVAFLYLDRFQTVQLAGSRDAPVVVLDEENRVREYNDGARDLFPVLGGEGALGRPLGDRLPEVADALDEEPPLVTLERGGETRYYRVATNPFAAGRRQLGRLLTVTDVTDRERYRRELERQNERLERFAGVVSHDLRNPLNVASGHLDIVRQRHDSEELRTVADALGRMEELIEDVLALARQGQPLDEPTDVALSTAAERAWQVVDTDDATLVVERDVTLRADPPRLQQLLENLFRNSVEHASTRSRPPTDDDVADRRPSVTVRVGALDPAAGPGFFVADDGPGVPEAERERVFEYGHSTTAEGTGFGLAIVEEVATAHGWTVTLGETDDGGARFEVANATVADDASERD